MDSVNELLDYVEKGRSAVWLALVEQQIGCERLRIVVIKILAWLKSQNRLRTKRPLDLNMAYPWCADLIDLLAPNVHLVSIFIISENTFDFREDVDEELRNEIRATVDRDYNPPLRIMR
jgi:hypothetical protein